MRAPALAKLHEIFLGQSGGPFELVAGKHYRCDTANTEIRKDASLAYKITNLPSTLNRLAVPRLRHVAKEICAWILVRLFATSRCHHQSPAIAEELDAITFDVSHDITFKSEISSFFPLSRGDDTDWQDFNSGFVGRIRISSGLSHVLDSVAQSDHDDFVRAILREISSKLRAVTLSKSPIRFPIILDGVKGIAEEIWLVGNQFHEFDDPFERLEALKRALGDPDFEWEGAIIRNELSLMFARDAMSGKLKHDQYREDVRRRKYSENHRLGWRLSEFHSTWALFQAFDPNTGKDPQIRMTSWIGEQRRYDLQLCGEETSLAFLFRSPVQLSFEEFERIRRRQKALRMVVIQALA